MDPLTHTVVGLAVSRALGRRSSVETGMVLVASNIPDVDTAFERIFALEWDHLFSHRGVTHSLALAPLEAVVVASVVWAVGRLEAKSRAASSWLRLVLLASVGLSVHLLLDITNDYGVRILLPFTARWYAWDLTGLLDFYILATLAVGLFVPALARLHGAEDDRVELVSRVASAAALAVIAGYLATQAVTHRLALGQLRDQAASAPVSTVACLPGSLSPLRWTGVVDTGSDVTVYDVRVSGETRGRQVFRDNADPRLEAAARRSSRVQALLSFARFPRFQAGAVTGDEGRSRHVVLVEDLRWLAPRGYVFGPAVRVWLDDDLRIVREEVQHWR